MTTTVTTDHTVWDAFDSDTGKVTDGTVWGAGDPPSATFSVKGSAINLQSKGTGVGGVGHTKSATNISASGVHIHGWVNSLDLPNTRALGGWRMRVSTSSSWGANYAGWYCGGIDTSRIIVRRFQPFVVFPDLSNTDESASPPANLTAITGMWLAVNQTTNSGQKTVYVDEMAWGTKTIFQGGTTPGLSGDSAEASASAIAYATFIEVSGAYFVLDGIDIGDGTTVNAYWNDNNNTWVFDDQNVSSTFYKVTLVGNATGTQSQIFGVKNGTGVDATGSGGNTFIAGGAAPFSFDVSDGNVDVAGFYGCIFNNAGHEDGTFLLTNANGEVVSAQFSDMGQITIGGGATFLRAGISNSVTAATGVEQAAVNLGTTKPATDTFKFVTISGASRYGLRIEGTSTVGDSWTFEAVTITDSGVADLLVDYPAQTGGNKVTINLVEGSAFSSATQVAVTGGIALADVEVVEAPVTLLINVKNQAGTNVQNARVFLETAATIASGEIFEAAVTSLTQSAGTATCTTTAAHGLEDGDIVVVRGAQPDGYNKAATVTVSSTTVFTYSVSSGLSSPATGTPVVSYVAINALTDASGNASITRSFAAAQQMKGWARLKNTSSPFYKDADLSFTINTTVGNTINAVLLDDE